MSQRNQKRNLKMKHENGYIAKLDGRQQKQSKREVHRDKCLYQETKISA